MSIQCGWLRRSYWMVVVIHIIGSDEHIAMLSSTVIITAYRLSGAVHKAFVLRMEGSRA